MFDKILNIFSWGFMLPAGIFALYLMLKPLITTNPEPIKSWCQNKPNGVVMETYHGKVNYDEPTNPYYYRETCYKKTMKDVVAFSEDTFGWVIRAECQADTTCFHNIQRIYVK